MSASESAADVPTSTSQASLAWQGDMFALVDLLHSVSEPDDIAWVGSSLCFTVRRSKASKRMKTQWCPGSGVPPPGTALPSDPPPPRPAPPPPGLITPAGSDGPPTEVLGMKHTFSAAALAHSLPPHLLGCCLLHCNAFGPRWGAGLASKLPSAVSPLQHVVWGVDALAGLCECVPDFPTKVLSGADLERFRSAVMDLVLLVLAAVAGPLHRTFWVETTDFMRQDTASDSARLASSCFTLLAQALSPQNSASEGDVDWEAVCEHLLLHAQSSHLVPLLFDVTGSLMVMVDSLATGIAHAGAGSGALGSDGLGSSGTNMLSALGNHVGNCLSTLAALCSMPLFYQALMMLDEHARAPLRVLANGLDVWRVAARVPTTCAGTLSLLAARCTALLLVLIQHFKPDFLERVMTPGSPSAPRMVFIAETLQAMMVHYCHETLKMHVDTDQGSPQLFVNLLRVAEILADETNFREGMIRELTSPLAAVLSCDSRVFESWWCGGEAVQLAHMQDVMWVYSVTYSAYQAALQMRDAAAELIHIPESVMRNRSRALPVGAPEPDWEKVREMCLERAVQLVKLLVNLHYFDEATCDPKMKDHFFSCVLDEWRKSGGPKEVKQRLGQAVKNLRALLKLVDPLFQGNHLGLEEDVILTEQDKDSVMELLGLVQSHMSG